MIELGVNIDHVATLRQARCGHLPSPLQAAEAAKRGGADGITLHLREDRRHIQDRDVIDIKNTVHLPLNLEMAPAKEIVRFALKYLPEKACLVPERRKELTTEGGLNVRKETKRLKPVIVELMGAGIEVSLFVDPDIDQIKAARDTGAKVIELHTGGYANAAKNQKKKYIEQLDCAAQEANKMGLIVNAGHGLDYENTLGILSISHLHELNIGHAIVAEAIMIGMEAAVRKMKEIISHRELLR